MADLRLSILDIVDHTGGLGFIDVIKVTTDTNTIIEAMDEEKTVIVSGTLKETESKFVGTFGMSKLSVLKGYAELSTNKSDTAKIDILTRERNGVTQAEEIVFKDDRGTPSSFRLMSAELVPAQAKFVGAKWDVSINPSKSAIAEFAQRAGILSQFETYFFPQVENGELRFHIGEIGGASHATYSIIADNVSGDIKDRLYWPIQQVLSILKLDPTCENTTLSIATEGALQIEINSTYANWKYILPARIK